jgi:hypothetical protein
MVFKSKFIYNIDAPLAGSGGETSVKTNEQIDKENLVRKQLGEAPLPYSSNAGVLTTTPAAETKPTEPVVKKEGEAAAIAPEVIEDEAQKLIRLRAAELEEEQKKVAAELRKETEGKSPAIIIKAKEAVVAKTDDTPASTTEDDIEEEKLLKALSKKAGKEITSLDEFFNPKVEETPEDKEAKLQKRENEKITFGLQNNKITKKEIESFIEDSKNPEGLAYSFFAASQKELDSTLTEDEIQERFDERYSVNEDKDSAAYKLGQKEISFIAGNILKQKHANYLSLENEYSAFEKNTQSQADYRNSIIKQAPQFKKDVESVAEKIKTISVSGYEVELDSSIVDGYKNQMLTPEYSEKAIANGWTLDELQSAMLNSAIIDHFDAIVNGVLDADRLKNQAGLKGIVPPKNTQPSKVMNDVQNERARELASRLGVQTN